LSQQKEDINGIGSPRDVPPPGTWPLLATNNIDVVPTADSTFKFAIAIVSAGGKTVYVANHLAAASDSLLANPPNNIHAAQGQLDNYLSVGGDCPSTTGTVVFASKSFSTSQLYALTSTTSNQPTTHTESGSQNTAAPNSSIVCSGEIASYTYTWTIGRSISEN
jgi:hypothetical protein